MNRRVDDGNVTIDFCAVFKRVNVGGIDRQGVSQVSRSKSVTHCKPLRKQISEQRYYSNFGSNQNQIEQGKLCQKWYSVPLVK